ncbi:hypothetical protein FHS18_000939 [Paenibacillus phyllosphaerae]|uniref:ATPase n=1 Tax=Paenibacillus phyllosphaerae TaxID=274593 RepID=A0A7W5AUK8_9BACL|nr:SRPBCC family protein [Paenibacillus phyllosphaerae]MBB3108887.1 hypothetical protein [Paenibacillus phyllosphaerae]
MVNVFTEIVIRCPRDVTAAYAANPENAPEWYANIDSAEWISGHAVQLGATIAFKAKFLGRELAYVYEISDYTPGERMVMRTADGPFPMETTYTWEDAEEGTRMTLRNRGNPSGFSAFVSPFMAIMMRRANEKDLRRIKDVLERRR